MCGITGLVRFAEDVTEDVLFRSADTLAHRGPDASGAWVSADRTVGLAHRRLAIIDLSERGRQPMADSAGRLVISFNGEIYNFKALREELTGLGHQFRTGTDTEVILEAYREWGTECLARCNGMFAFALYDQDRRQLFLARDRAGEKPLFYEERPEGFYFASELKALLVFPGSDRVLAPEALNHYLAYGYVAGESCILKGVRKLRAGHALVVDIVRRTVREWTFWKLPMPEPEGVVDELALVEELDGLLRDSVKLRLEADVPVGVLLSGGLDSSLVTAYAAGQVSRLKTFTITFPGHAKYNEAEFAALVARHFGTEHTELPAPDASYDLLPLLARHFDEPMADSSMIPTYLVSRLIRSHATVALGGDGGDELFGGYPHNSWLLKQERLRAFVPAWARRAVSALTSSCVPNGVRGRNYLLSFGETLDRSIAQVNIHFDAASRARLLAPLGARLSDLEAPERAKAAYAATRGDLVDRACASDFNAYLVDDLLVKVDRASMATALEVRAPMLDHRLIEFAFRKVPGQLKATRDARKVLLKKLAARVLPPALDVNRKQGFSLPLDHWFAGPWKKLVTEILHDASPDLFDQRFLSGLWEGQQRGRNNSQRIFSIVLFELWRRTYKIELG